jgi:cytochrome c oxidase assembly factor CtaG
MPHPLLALSAARSASELIPTALVGLLYARRAHTLAGTSRGVPRWRQACFYAGLLIATVAILALDHTAAVSLYWRIVQLLLIGDVATFLVVLGLNAALVAPLLRTHTMQRLRVLSNPPLAFALWTANVYLWLLSPLYPAALEHAGIRALQDLCFVVFGINMWICLLGPLPMGRWFADGAKALYILAVRIGAVVLANLFLWSGSVFSPYYTHSDGARHLSPLADQNIAGAIMLGEAALVTLALFAWLYRRTLGGVQAPTRVFDFDRELIREFSEPQPRPRRAPAAARGGELRRRRFQPEADPAPALGQREVLDSR